MACPLPSSKALFAMFPRRVIFVHPDLGIGGAEKLVVNAAQFLHSRGDFQVSILTAHHSPDHCFNATKPGGVLGDRVHVHGDWLPRTIGGRFHVVCAILRMVWVALVLLCSEWWLFVRGRRTPAVIFCDQVSHVVPLLSLTGLPVLFYCHFPDKLLCVEVSIEY
jgi:alpha-1,3/alpha-1,6-mannosyltransferase